MTTINFPTPDPVDRQFTPQGYCLDSGHDCSEHPMPDMRPLARQTCCRCLKTTTDYKTEVVNRRTGPAVFHTCRDCAGR